MLVFDKTEIRQTLTQEDIFELLQEFGGDPSYASFGIVSATICHNPPGEGSRKLYWYSNSGLFHCYTGCEEPSFDIFQLVIKVMRIQAHREYDLNDAVRWVAARFGISGKYDDAPAAQVLADWEYLANYGRIQEIQIKANDMKLPEYDTKILENLNYNVRIEPWIQEGISQEVMKKAMIGYYPGGNQITIPHFDKDGRFIGLRGRTLSKEDAEMFGKYRPVKINGQLYNHPLGLNLYGLNWNKNAINTFNKAFIFESEKSVLKLATWFGWEKNMSVACCGSNISAYQIQLLINAGAKEIIVAFDRQFQAISDDEFKHLKANLLKIHNKFKNYVQISFIFDKEMITGYKDAPCDCGLDIFNQLYRERIIL